MFYSELDKISNKPCKSDEDYLYVATHLVESQQMQIIMFFSTFSITYQWIGTLEVQHISSRDELELDFHEPSQAELRILRAESSWPASKNELNTS